MGVMSTHCGVCGIPVHHSTVEGEKFKFGKDHEWMKKAVAVGKGKPAHGTVEDSELTTAPAKGKSSSVYVANGLGAGDAIALHEYCWEALGSPTAAKNLPLGAEEDPSKPNFEGAIYSDAWADIRPYMEQDFNFDQMDKDGKSWALLDPSSKAGAKSKERIAAILKFKKKLLNSEQVEKNRDLAKYFEEPAWSKKEEASKVVDFRTDLKDFDRKSFSTLVIGKKSYPATPNGLPSAVFDAILDEVKNNFLRFAATSKAELLVAVIKRENAGEFLIYTKDPEGAKSILKCMQDFTMGSATTIDQQEDAQWSAFDKAIS